MNVSPASTVPASAAPRPADAHGHGVPPPSRPRNMPPTLTRRQTSSPHLEDARLAILHDYLQLRAGRFENRTATERHAERGLKAVALAPTLKVCRALLAGERVHWTGLHAIQAERYGLRRRRPDGRYSLDDFNSLAR
jgi:hypothetical protein